MSQLTSIKSSYQCTLSSLMMKERVAWNQLRSYLLSQSPNSRSRQVQNGLQPFKECPKLWFSFSPTEGRNPMSMPSTLKSKTHQRPLKSHSVQINRSETKSVGGQNTLLTNYQCFHTLSEAILHSDGVEYRQPRGGKRGRAPLKAGGGPGKAGKGKKDIC